MIVRLYAIFDSASGVYDGPFRCKTDGEARRMFIDIASDAEHPIGKHPADYTLMCVGKWNDGTGHVMAEGPSKIINGLEAVASAQKVDEGQIDAFLGANGLQRDDLENVDA